MTSWRRVPLSLLLLLAVTAAAQQSPSQHPARTRVVLLGTGTPVPDPEHSGAATAVVVGDSAYLVDFGPGVVRRAQAAVLERGITALEPGKEAGLCDAPSSRALESRLQDFSPL